MQSCPRIANMHQSPALATQTVLTRARRSLCKPCPLSHTAHASEPCACPTHCSYMRTLYPHPVCNRQHGPTSRIEIRACMHVSAFESACVHVCVYLCVCRRVQCPFSKLSSSSHTHTHTRSSLACSHTHTHTHTRSSLACMHVICSL